MVALTDDQNEEEATSISNHEETTKHQKKVIAIGTLVAFSFHSFLEGIALGSEKPDLQIIGLIIVFSFS